LNFAAFHFEVLGLMVGVREIVAYGRNAGTSMRSTNNVIGIESVPDCPPRPNASNGRRGVDQHAIQVEQESAARDLGNVLR
jgi:hypothetical protein